MVKKFRYPTLYGPPEPEQAHVPCTSSTDKPLHNLSRQKSSQGQVLSDAQRQEILSLMQSSMGDVAEVAATRAIKSMHQLGLGRPIETETVREENASCGEGLLQAPNTLQQQQQQQQGARWREVLHHNHNNCNSRQHQQQTASFKLCNLH